ncbi:hypothetical protein CCM_00593 [Cordyceps militaris CM01]|uniref:Uncharacterized protein n=1 Tax=Cordyceps militaris (strain CM01) TaxID=983644 RepID=G3J4X2_CORMM|nr:uncharacterized protein CCM_00593 [Cordyceps militaris CM01]EGX95939.1 hypothetical protein CCM_00593 [Cordyceps militaris CM01]
MYQCDEVMTVLKQLSGLPHRRLGVADQRLRCDEAQPPTCVVCGALASERRTVITV